MFQNGKIALEAKGTEVPNAIPLSLETSVINMGAVDKGRTDGDMWAEIAPSAAIPESLALCERRTSWLTLGEEKFFRAGKAFHLMNWQRTHKFCGNCGAPTSFDAGELSMKCEVCGEQHYPVICPAVITSVVKDGTLLMGHGINFPPGRFSVLAGFTEPGESLEETVMREIYEESGIRVKNIKYFGSQPWPFPNSLMVGFTAEWESGEITPYVTEVTEVKWCAPNEIPDYYRGVSISAKLIEDFVRKYS